MNYNKLIKILEKDIKQDVANIFRKASEFSIKENTENVFAKTKKVLVKEKKVASGKLLRSIRKKYLFKNENFSGIVYTKLNYADEIIEGIPPGKLIPPNKLKNWIIAKKKQGEFTDINKPKELTHLVYAIRTKIFKEGIKPFDFFGKAVFNSGGEEFIKDRLRVKFNKSFSARISKLKKDRVINI